MSRYQLLAITLLFTTLLPAAAPTTRTPPAQLATPPEVITGEATNITSSAARLQARVNPQGQETTIAFEWGIDPVYDVRFTTPQTRSDSGFITIIEIVTGLQPGTTYFYRAIASNSAGSTRGEVRTFSTSGNPTDGADLSVAQFEPFPAVVGQPLTYTINVRNNGPRLASSIRLTDTLPLTVAFQQVQPPPPTCAFGIYTPDENSVVCNLGELAPGERRQISIVVVPQAAGTITNSVEVSAAERDPNRLNNRASIDTLIETVPRGASVELVVSPEQGGILTLTTTQGYTVSLTMPPGAVRKTTAIILSDLPAGPTRPLPAFVTFAQRAFLLETFQDGVIQPDFPLERPATLSLSYNTRLLTDTSRLWLFRSIVAASEQEQPWQDAALNGNYTTRNGILTIQITALSEHALVVLPPPRSITYLPLVRGR